MILAKRGFDNFTYTLHPVSERRLREAHPDGAPPSRITIAFDTKSSVDAMHAAVLPGTLPLLTGLTPEDIEQMGGVEVYEPTSARAVWYWPLRQQPASIPSANAPAQRL